VSVIDVHIRCA